MGQLCERLDIQAEHGELHVELGLVKGPEISEAGIVDEGSNLEPAPPDLASCSLRAVRGREILHNDLDANAVLFLERFSQRFELVLASREKHEVATVLGRDVGERFSDAR